MLRAAKKGLGAAGMGPFRKALVAPAAGHGGVKGDTGAGLDARDRRADGLDGAAALVADGPGVLDALAADAALIEVMHIGAADADAGHLMITSLSFFRVGTGASCRVIRRNPVSLMAFIRVVSGHRTPSGKNPSEWASPLTSPSGEDGEEISLRQSAILSRRGGGEPGASRRGSSSPGSGVPAQFVAEGARGGVLVNQQRLDADQFRPVQHLLGGQGQGEAGVVRAAG